MVTVAASKPSSQVALLLAEAGIEVIPQEEEGNLERYFLSPRVVVERRTGSGFLQGIVDKTLFASAVDMRTRFDIPVLIVEGTMDYCYTAFRPEAARGALTALMLVYGVNVLSSPDAAETAALIATVARQEQVGVPEVSLIPKRKAVDLPDMQRRVVEMLPGCGLALARDLLQYFGSVWRLANASEAELRRVRGVGPKKAAEIYALLHVEYASLDTERDLEDVLAAAPELLLSPAACLLARQHALDRQDIVDLVFLDEAAGELILVELKRGALQAEHETQLQRYLDRADASSTLRAHLDRGLRLRGVLATATACAYAPCDPRITAVVVDRERAIEVLKGLRRGACDRD